MSPSLTDFHPEYTRLVKSICSTYGERGTYVEKALLEGGKYVRPLLFLQALQGWGGKIDTQAYAIASAIELLHNFFLIHDDVMDDDTYRRDALTLHAYFGQGGKEVEGRALAIVFGDVVYNEAMDVFCTHIPDRVLLREVIDIIRETSRGQIMEMEASHIPTEEALLKFYEMKTALYSLYLPLLLAHGMGNPPCTKDEVEQCARILGRAYQLYDDLIEVLGMKKRRDDDVCGDIVRMKATPLFVRFLQMIDETERERFLQKRSLGEDLTKAEQEYVRQALFDYGIVDDIKQQMKDDLAEAKKRLVALGLGDVEVLTTLLASYEQL